MNADHKRTARITGLLYLALAVSGTVGFLLVRQKLFVADDANATLANLVAHEGLARLGVAADLTVVFTQALAALGFYRLLSRWGPFAAGALVAFGFINAVVLLVSTACTATALQLALRPGAEAASVHLLYVLSGSMWAVGALFFGLWLIPMGSLVMTSRALPRGLGWVLIAGGVGYIISAYVGISWPDAPAAVDAVLTGLATLGEFWMIGYLLIFGVRDEVAAT